VRTHSTHKRTRAQTQGTGVIDANKLDAAHYLLRPFLLRRVKSEVESRLPPKVETRINCPLSEFQTVCLRSQ
jgi:SWI/SNF-related matrix-associated actin-dependent regulator of chromatin subfamily A member 5